MTRQASPPRIVEGSGSADRSPPPPGVTHKVKRTYVLERPASVWFVWECWCGASSALHQNESDANAAYERHKRGY